MSSTSTYTTYTSNDWKTFIIENFYTINDEIDVRINLEGLKLDDENIQRFAEGLNDVARRQTFLLTSLNLSKNLFSEKGLDALVQVLVQFSNLKDSLEFLDLSKNNIKTIEPLARAGVFKNLARLELNDCGLSGELPALRMPKLQGLKLSDNSGLVFSDVFLHALNQNCVVIAELGNFDVKISLKGRGGFGGPPTVQEIREAAALALKPVRPVRRRSKRVSSPLTCQASVCSNRAQFQCEQCQNQFYCGARCQSEHWTEHSLTCGEPVALPAMIENVDSFVGKVDTDLYRNFLIAFNSGLKVPQIQRVLRRYITMNDELDLAKFEQSNFKSQRFKNVLKKREFLGQDFGKVPSDEELARLASVKENLGKTLLQISLEKDRAEYDTLSPLKKSQVLYDVLVSLIDVFTPQLPLKLKEELGSGTYGTVYRAEAKGYGTFAAKVFFDETGDADDLLYRRESAEEERTLLTFVNRYDMKIGKGENDHVLAFVGYYPEFEFKGKNVPMLLSEYISGITLEEIELIVMPLDSGNDSFNKKRQLTPWKGKEGKQEARAERAREATKALEKPMEEIPKQDLRVIFPMMVKQMFEGLKFLHSKGIAHRDLKPDNVMWDDSQRLVLIDLGLSCQVNDERLAERILAKFQCDADDYKVQGGSWAFNSPEVSAVYLKNYRIQSGEFDDEITNERPPLETVSIEVQLKNDLWAAALTLFDVLYLADPNTVTRAIFAMKLGGFMEIYEGFPSYIGQLAALSKLTKSRDARQIAIERMGRPYYKMFRKEVMVLGQVMMGDLKSAEQVLERL